jgi:aryl-alcohol dehydrogenase-like predicted oxidoreductase
MAQMAIAWVLQNKNIASAIVGATRPDQLDDNVKAANIVLEPAILSAIDKALEGIIVSDPRLTVSPKTRI